MSFTVATSILALKAKKFLNLRDFLTTDKTVAMNVPGGAEAVKAGTQPPLQHFLLHEEAILDVESAKVSMGKLDVKTNVIVRSNKENMVIALKGSDMNTMAGPFPSLLSLYLHPLGSQKKLIQSKENQHAQGIFWEVAQLLLTGHREGQLQIARRSERQVVHYRRPSSLSSRGAPTSKPVTLRRIEVTQATKASIIVRMQVVNALLVLHGSLEYIQVISVATAVLVLPVSGAPRPLALLSVPSESVAASPILAAEPIVAFGEPQSIQASDVRPRGLSVNSSMGDMSKYDFEDPTDADDADAPLRRSESVKDLKASSSSLVAPPSPPRTPVPSSPPLAASLTPSKSIANIGEALSPAIADGQGLPRSQSMTGRAMWFPNAVHAKQPYAYASQYTPTLPRAVLVRTTNHPPKSPPQALNPLEIENSKKINNTATSDDKENAPGIETAPAGVKPKTVGSRSWRRAQRILRHQQQNALAGASTSRPPAGAWRWDEQRARYGQANPPMRLFGAALRQATPSRIYDPSTFFRGTPPPMPPPPMQQANAGAASSRLRADAPVFRPSGHLRPQLHLPTGTST